MIQRAQSQDPTTAGQNINNSSAATFNINGSSGQVNQQISGAIKISNKRIQVIQGSNKVNKTKK